MSTQVGNVNNYVKEKVRFWMPTVSVLKHCYYYCYFIDEKMKHRDKSTNLPRDTQLSQRQSKVQVLTETSVLNSLLPLFPYITRSHFSVFSLNNILGSVPLHHSFSSSLQSLQKFHRCRNFLTTMIIYSFLLANLYFLDCLLFTVFPLLSYKHVFYLVFFISHKA